MLRAAAAAPTVHGANPAGSLKHETGMDSEQQTIKRQGAGRIQTPLRGKAPEENELFVRSCPRGCARTQNKNWLFPAALYCIPGRFSCTARHVTAGAHRTNNSIDQLRRRKAV